jgi:cholesterol oxidase
VPDKADASPASRSKRERACYLGSLWKLASRAGEVRRFDYCLKIGKIIPALPGAEAQALPNGVIRSGDVIRASKRLTYNRRANPWRQLMELRLEAMPALAERDPVLKLDARFFADQGLPLLRITGQDNQANALAELIGFGLHVARVLMSTHLWTFRKPDTADDREPVRLPGPIAGLEPPEVTELAVNRMPHGPARPCRPRAIRGHSNRQG